MRVTYWTTCSLEPEIEAVAKEVFDLARHFRGSRIIGVSQHLAFRVRWRERCLGFNASWTGLLRAATPALECATDVNHVYGEISPWLFARILRRKPILLTIASEKGEPNPEFIERCRAIVVQTESMRRRLQQYGVENGRLRVIYPGVDLARFTPRSEARARTRPRILFATFPRTAEEFETRGVNLLLQIARACPGIELTFLSRPWGSGGTALPAVKEAIASGGLRNVQLLEGVQANMESLYREHDFTVIPFTTADGGKECPLSLVETLACGVPVLISGVAPFSRFVAEQDCGGVFDVNPQSFAATVEQALSTYARLSRNAAACARAWFDKEATLRTYADLYRALS